MNLYRIDRTDHRGISLGPVCDILGPRLTNRRAKANQIALEAATTDPPVFAHIIRIQGVGDVRRVGIVAPGSKTISRTNDSYIPR